MGKKLSKCQKIHFFIQFISTSMEYLILVTFSFQNFYQKHLVDVFFPLLFDNTIKGRSCFFRVQLFTIHSFIVPLELKFLPLPTLPFYIVSETKEKKQHRCQQLFFISIFLNSLKSLRLHIKCYFHIVFVLNFLDETSVKYFVLLLLPASL